MYSTVKRVCKLEIPKGFRRTRLSRLQHTDLAQSFRMEWFSTHTPHRVEIPKRACLSDTLERMCMVEIPKGVGHARLS